MEGPRRAAAVGSDAAARHPKFRTSGIRVARGSVGTLRRRAPGTPHFPLMRLDLP